MHIHTLVKLAPARFYTSTSLYVLNLAYPLLQKACIWAFCRRGCVKFEKNIPPLSTRLKTLQKKAVRLINRAKYNSYTDPLFQSSGILKIDDIYKIECVKLYLKNRKNLLTNYLSQQHITNNEIHTYNTRQTDDIHNRTIRSRLEEQLLNTKISKVWNNLPNSIKELSSISRLKQYFLSLYQINCNILNCYICNR